ncbi:hypothetical protein L596_026372 [Steinernema carpocapsae]|uniref:Uncharacterized protein n=1 Tax=Steinernema carpocapsae TaxID=34508 RepID=A0A4U5M144_STECR|nr:hypothetical protein L596_026372 [Steinernema carpocapsae]
MLSDEASSSMLPSENGTSSLKHKDASVYYKIARLGRGAVNGCSGGVVVDDCAQFSLEEDDDVPVVIPLEERLHNPRHRHSPNEPLIEYRLESDDEDSSTKDKLRTPNRGTSKRNGATNGKELSRLTDEFEVDGDSASDELDLIPPMPSAGSSSKRFKIPSKLLCCSSRVPLKCAIM